MGGALAVVTKEDTMDNQLETIDVTTLTTVTGGKKDDGVGKKIVDGAKDLIKKGKSIAGGLKGPGRGMPALNDYVKEKFMQGMTGKKHVDEA
ncbi:MAG: hypothetical protein AB7P03_26885 [Kofleriaceae bacterium]